MAKIVEIKRMPLVDEDHKPTGQKALIMFLDCGHGYIHTSNLETGEYVYCSKCNQ